VPLAKPTKIKIVISAANRAALAMQFQGVLSEYSQGGGAIEDTVVAALDRWITLSKRNLNEAGVVVTKADGTGTFAAGTDYVIDHFSGQIKFPTAGSVVADASMKVVANAQAVSGTRIRGAAQTRVRCRARFVGANMVDDAPVTVTVHEAQLRSTQGFDFLASDFNGIQLEGTLVKPADKTEPFTVDFDNATA
jgi:hypothetical protein